MVAEDKGSGEKSNKLLIRKEKGWIVDIAIPEDSRIEPKEFGNH